MKVNKLAWFDVQLAGEALAFFGQARFVRHRDGRHNRVTGSKEHRSTDRKCSLLASELALAVQPGPQLHSTRNLY